MCQTYEDKFPFDVFFTHCLVSLILLLCVTENEAQFKTSIFTLVKIPLAEYQCSALCLILLLRPVHYTKKNVELSTKDQFNTTFWCTAINKIRWNVCVCVCSH
jgi:hypothetical protein